MLHNYSDNAFLGMIGSVADGAQPGTTWGTAVTLGASNTMGSYAQVIDGSADWPAGFGDGYWLVIEVSDIGVSAANHEALVTVGIDLSGGTTYTDWIENLLVSSAQAVQGNGLADGIMYGFPLRVPNGASLALKGQDRNAAPSTARCRMFIYGQPTHPERVRAGSFVRSFGVDTTNSRGTYVTHGGASEGSWAQLGSALAEHLWFWEFGLSRNSTAFSAQSCFTDIAVGDASNKRRVIRNAHTVWGTAETQTKYPAGEFGPAAAGDLVYGRGQIGDGAVPGASVMSIAAYGVGG